MQRRYVDIIGNKPEAAASHQVGIAWPFIQYWVYHELSILSRSAGFGDNKQGVVPMREKARIIFHFPSN